jgi:beta-lactamase class A
MKRFTILMVAALSASACARGVLVQPAPNQSAGVNRLEARIRERISRDAGTTVAVYVIDLASGLRVDINGNESMHAASTMKVPVLFELFRQAEAGRLNLEDSIPVSTTFRSLIGDTAYALTAGSDSDSTLYRRAGSKASLRELARLMITRSSNLATNMLIDRVSAAEVMATMQRIGGAGMVVLRGVEDGPAFRRGLNNTATAGSFAVLLEAIARCTAHRRASCDEMLQILSDQEFNETIPAGIPRGTRVAHKTGWITGIHHDGGIVFPPGRQPYILVILTRGARDRAVAIRLGTDISRLVWEGLADSRSR